MSSIAAGVLAIAGSAAAQYGEVGNGPALGPSVENPGGPGARQQPVVEHEVVENVPAPAPGQNVVEDTVGGSEPSPSVVERAPEGGLPFTGADVAQLVGVALVALATGAALLRRARRPTLA